MKKLVITSLLLIGSTTAFTKDVIVTLHIPSMNCVTCPITVTKSLERVDGVIQAKVTFENKLAVVTFDDAMTNINSLTEATKNAGFPSVIKP
jgi:mercuric ion binding protein